MYFGSRGLLLELSVDSVWIDLFTRAFYTRVSYPTIPRRRCEYRNMRLQVELFGLLKRDMKQNDKL